jgi:hypothetical protein
MKERRQHIQNIISRKEDYSLVYYTMPDNVSKLVALIVYKSPKIIALSFIYPKNNHYC